jgi:hypothetical protein
MAHLREAVNERFLVGHGRLSWVASARGIGNLS